MRIIGKLFGHFKRKDKPNTRDISVLMEAKPGDIVIDCGANTGQEVEHLVKTGATVYAFEPNPYAFEILEKRFGSYSNIHLRNEAVLDRDTEMDLYLHVNSDMDEVKWSTGSSILSSKSNINKNKKVRVKVVDLVKFVNSLKSRIKLLKIDVEGVEYEILEKLIETETYKKIDKIFVETHLPKMPDLKHKDSALRDKLKKLKISNINLDWI